MLTVGTLLQYGKYRVDEVLAVKGSSVTYRATQDDRKQTVIIKAAPAESVSTNVGIGRFLAEARHIANLDHPHIVRVDDCFVEENRLFLVTDFIVGQPLSRRLREGPIPVPDALRYIRQIGEAITFMHREGLLHRNVKPSNIMVSEDAQRATLIDFNLARTLSPRETPVDLESACDGFVPPEPFASSQLWTAAADIYGLSATLYALITGKAPALIQTSQDSSPQLESQLLIAPELDQAIARGMAFKVEDRPSTLQEWLALLPRELCSDESSTATDGQSNLVHQSDPANPGAAQSSALSPPANHAPSLFTSAVSKSFKAQKLILRKPQDRESKRVTPLMQRQAPSLQKQQAAQSIAAQTRFPHRLLLLSAIVSGLAGAGFGLFLKTHFLFPSVFPNRASLLMPAQNIEEAFPPKGIATTGSQPQTSGQTQEHTQEQIQQQPQEDSSATAATTPQIPSTSVDPSQASVSSGSTDATSSMLVAPSASVSSLVESSKHLSAGSANESPGTAPLVSDSAPRHSIPSASSPVFSSPNHLAYPSSRFTSPAPADLSPSQPFSPQDLSPMPLPSSGSAVP